MENITAFASKYRNWLIGAGILLLIVILYFAFKNDGDEVVDGECPASFTIKPSGGIAQVISTTYSIIDGRWFKQLSGSALGVSGQLPKQEISQVEFIDACKKYKTPQTGPNQA